MRRGWLGCLLGLVLASWGWAPTALAQDGAETPTAAVEDPSTLTWEKAWDTGFALYREARYTEAVPYLERALELEPEDPTVRAYLAECHRQLGDEAAAAALSTPGGGDGAEASGGEGEEAGGSGAAAATDDDGDDDDGDDDDWDDDVVEHGDGHDCEADGHDCKHRRWNATREGRHLGFGLALAGNALSVGIYVEALPVRFLAVEGGWGVGNARTMFWWGQLALLPANTPITPGFGAGVLGNYGLDYRFRADLPGGRAEYYLGRVAPYLHLGLSYVSRHGFSFALDVNAVFTGDRSLPLAPWVGLRVGFLI